MPDLVYVSAAEFERVRDLNAPRRERTELFAGLCRLNTLYMIARAGSGHIGSSFSSLDIVAQLFLGELRLKPEGNDLYFSSKGHDAPGLYAVLIGLGLLDFDLLHRLRRLHGLPGHPDVSLPYVASNTGSLGMGISKAKGMALANRLQGRRAQIYVMTGDGELQEGQFWESLGQAANLGLSELTVIVDHNKLQSDTRVSNVNDLGDLEQKLSSFGWHVERCNGHDFDALADSFARMRAARDRPSILVADTLKGRGVSFMESLPSEPDGLYAYHSGAPSESDYAHASHELISRINGRLDELSQGRLETSCVKRSVRKAPLRPQRLVQAYSRELVAQGRRDPALVVLDGDLVLDCGLIPFRDAFPERFFECGIAEQDMVSQAGGMALEGLLPIVHSFACFLSTRPNEQIYNNATEHTKIIYVGSLAGLLPGGPGHSHQSVRDISALAAIPELVMLEPSTEVELKQALEFAIHRTSKSVYLRLVSIPCDVPFELPAGASLELGRGTVLREGKDALLIGYGPVLLPEALRAASILDTTYGIGLGVIDLPWLNHVDDGWLGTILAGYTQIFTLDNHYVIGGQGEMVSSAVAGLRLAGSLRVTHLGVERVPECGTNDEVLRAHRLDAESLAQRVFDRLQSP